MYCSGFVGEDGVGGSGPIKNLHQIMPTALLFLPAADSHHLKNLQDQLHSVLRKIPIRENGVFVGKMKFHMLPDWLVYIVYVCSGFSFVSSKLTNKLILVVTVSVCMLIHDYRH
jgi:hypothetical protein